MRRNIILDTDAYKLTHWRQFPKGMTKGYSYGESRIGAKYPFLSWFGLRGIIQDHLLQPVTNEMIEEAEEEAFLTFGHTRNFNKVVWEKVRDLGYLPIRICAAREGSKIPISNVLFTIESTEDWFANTYNSLEGLLMHVWHPTTVATRSMYIKENLTPIFKATCDYPDLILPFAVNDFGFRGTEGHEAAGRAGAGHLVHFMGSDNMPANRFIKDFYGMKGRLKSVWATEHSVATAFGPGKGEVEYVMHQLREAHPEDIVSLVIDSYNQQGFIKEVVGENAEVKQAIIDRPGRVVFRPDRGEAINNVVHNSDVLASIFGFSINQHSHKVLSNNVGLLQGDGMDEDTIISTYKDYVKTGWGAENFITGSGGGLLEKDLTRDTQRFAIKGSYAEFYGVPRNLQKGGSGDETKASKPGMLKLHRSNFDYMTISSAKENPAEFNSYADELQIVLEDGKFTGQSFEDVIAAANGK